MTHIEDDEILKLIGDDARRESGYRMLLEKYQHQLYLAIRRIVLLHEDADDVFQNTMLKIFRYIHSFERRSKLSTWMIRIATNEAISFLRSKKHTQSSTTDLQDQLVQALKADPHFEGDELQIALQKAVDQLPEKQRLVFTMKYYDDMKYSTMREILQTSEGALKASYHHAVKKIQEEISKSYSID